MLHVDLMSFWVVLFIFHLHQPLSMPIKNPSTHQLMPLLATIEQVFKYPSQGTHMLALSLPFFLTSTTTNTIQLSTTSPPLLSGVLWDMVIATVVISCGRCYSKRSTYCTSVTIFGSFSSLI